MSPYIPRVAAIHDLSGFGKCSLTVVLPILSAMGVEACALPTAILSSHTGGLVGYTYRDLTDDLPAIATHWEQLNISFDAIYTGFAASRVQLELIEEIIMRLQNPDTLIFVDPVLGDHGALYRTYTSDMVDAMRTLCKMAHVITPNLTEAAFLLDQPYDPAPQEPERLCKALHALGPGQIVITGVGMPGDRLGAAAYDVGKDEFKIHAMPRAPGIWHGTGDIFGSVLLGALLTERSLDEATRLAVRFTQGSILRTWTHGGDPRHGVDFEAGLRELLNTLYGQRSPLCDP